MTTNQLRYFVSAAENQSFTKAAAQFYISQTAITQQIKLLEETVGCALFDRSKRPVALTPAGEAFLIEAKSILEHMNAAVGKAHDASIGIRGSLRVGYIRGYEHSLLVNLFQEYHNRHPEVLLTCHRNTSDELATGLLNREYDLIFTWDSTNLRAIKDLNAKSLEKSRLCVAMYKQHPLAGEKSLKRERLKDEPILYMSPSNLPDSYGDSFYMSLYQKAGFKPNIICRSSDLESILIMIAAGEGISILPEYYKHQSISDNIVFIPLQGAYETEEILTMYLESNTNPALLSMVKMLEV